MRLTGGVYRTGTMIKFDLDLDPLSARKDDQGIKHASVLLYEEKTNTEPLN